MNTKFNLLLTTALLIASPALAEGTPGHDCANSVTCNNGSINKDNISQDIVSNDNQYAPDSATANASVGDVIAQGGTGGNATGNTSSNDNKSSADNSLSNQQFGNSSAHTGNNTNTIGDQTFNGSNTMGDMTGTVTGTNTNNNANVGVNKNDNASSATANGGAGGSATGGNATGGTVGDTSSASNSSISGSGNSSNKNANNQGQSLNNHNVSQSAGGKAQQSQNASSRNSVNNNIDASTRIKHAANTAYAPNMGGYGQQNCFGDTNPSGAFSAGIQTFGWGVTAGSSKASNVCAIVAVGGARAGAAYLAAMDPNAHRALVAAGVVTTTSRVKAEAQSRSIASIPYTTCEVRNGAPYIVAKRGRADEAKAACMAALGAAPVAAPVAAPAPICPTGSKWDGKGCWMPRR